MHLSWYFQQKPVLRWLLDLKCKNCGTHSFPCQSLLLSTTVLNDSCFVLASYISEIILKG